MAIGKQKTEGGQGGRLGHSNMSHWVYTEEIKIATRKRRRLDSKEIITEALGKEVTMVDDNMNIEKTIKNSEVKNNLTERLTITDGEIEGGFANETKKTITVRKSLA